MEGEWDLFRRGQLDQERHHKLVQDAVKKNLSDLIVNADINAGGKVRVPVKELRQYQFRFDPETEQESASVADPDSPGQPGSRPRKGTVIGHRPQKGEGSGPGSDSGGEGFYEVEINLAQVADELFAGLELPRIQRKIASKAYKEEFKMEDIRRKGPLSNLDKKLTVLNNIRRNAAKGDAHFGGLDDDDLRFRTPDLRRVPQDQVAVIFVRDRSGSMGEREKYLTRVLSFWITRFLQYKYKKICETAFVLFDTVAVEVTEEDYFHRNESGGTAVSSGFIKAQEIIAERFPPANYNLYVFCFSDGDNISSDTPKVVEIVRALLPLCNLIGYTDIIPSESQTTYRTGTSQVRRELSELKHPYLVTVGVHDNADVLKAMRVFFGKNRAGEVSA